MLSPQEFVVKWIEYAATGGILLLAAGAVVGRLRQPTDRIKVILMSFVAAALVPLLVGVAQMPGWHLGLVVATPTKVAQPTSIPIEATSPVASAQAISARSPLEPQSAGPRGARAQAAVDVRPAHSPAGPPRPVDRWWLAAIAIVAVHCLALALFVSEWFIGWQWLRRMTLRAVPAGEAVRAMWARVTGGCGGRVRLLVSSEVTTPLTFGYLRPTVVVPDSISSGDPAAVRFCLAHEWSHVASGDLCNWRLSWFCQFMLWYQPLFWVLRRELRVCQDFLADDRASNARRDAVEYSVLLMEFAHQRMCRPVAGAIAFLDRSSQLSRRVKMLLVSSSTLRSRSPLTFCLLAAGLSLVGAVLTSAIRLESAEADDAQVPNSQKQEDPKEQPAAPPAEQPTSLHYSGVVLDKETGKGIPNATVVVRRSKYTPQETTVIQETTHKTDAEGKYSFDIPPDQVAVSSLYIELDVEHDDYAAQKGFGYALSMIRKNEVLGERPFFEKVELRPSEPITGTVVDPDGKPLAGVKIQGYSKANASDFRDYGSFTDTITDDAGKFRLALVKGGVGVFWVLPTGFASTSRAINKERGDVGEIRLRPGVRVAGRVIDTEGKPVAGVPVNIQYEGGGNETVNNLPVATSIRRSCITDDDGHFAFDPLPTGEYRVIPEEHHYDAIIRDRTRYEIPGVFLPMKIKLQDGVECAPIEVQASPHVVLNAQYLDSKGNRTRGHEVHVFGRMDGQFWFGSGRPNSEGTISMRIPHGLQQVQLNLMTNEHGALRFRRGKGKELENRQVRVELGTVNDDVEGFEIVRYVAPIVLVNAIDADGKQVKDFRVAAAYPWGKQDYILEGELRSDLSFEHQNDGRYRTSQMLPDEDVKFTVTAPGYEPASETVRLAEGETKDLVLTLKKAGEAK